MGASLGFGQRGAERTPGPETPTWILTVGFARAVERTGHERVVLGGVAEHDELCRADALTVCRQLEAFLTASPISLMASMFRPALVAPMLTELQTMSVSASARGMDR